ncbi:MAG: hypothetical protein MZW92_63905 [Comamonadaceae bacterium]|nr:hypothetical protein [Comamonadaceae bacterium]
MFTPYKNAWLKQLDAVLPAAPTRSSATPRALAPRPPASGRCRRWPTSASSRPTCTRCSCPAACRRRASCSTTSCERIDRYTRRRDFPAVKGPSLPVACTCASAPSRSAQLARDACAAHGGGRAAPRPGCAS